MSHELQIKASLTPFHDSVFPLHFPFHTSFSLYFLWLEALKNC